jgi:hypothetical protein
MEEEKLKLKLDPKHFEEKDFVDIKPMGFLEPEDNPEDYIFGATTKIPDEILRANGQYLDVIIEKEWQKKNGVETMGCTFFGTNNATEIIIKAKYGEDWNGSDRAGNILANNTKNGNNPKNPAEVLKATGIPEEKVLPFDSTCTSWEKYHSPKPLPQNILAECAKWVEKWQFLYAWVPTDKESLKNALKRGALGISVTAWQMRNGLYYNDNAETNNHWCTLIGYEEGKCWYIFDSYDAWVKKLEWNYAFKYAMQYYIKKKEVAPLPPTINNKDMLKTIKFKTDNRVFVVNPVDEKRIIHIYDKDGTSEKDWEIMKNENLITRYPVEIEDGLFPHYTIIPFVLNGDMVVQNDTNPFTAIINAILNAFGLGKKK